MWADNTTEEFQYDLQGRLKRKICKDKNEISYTYNMYNSLTSRRSNGGMEKHFQYYNDGKLKSAMAGGVRYEYSYYTDGMLKEKTASGRTLLTYEYDSLNRLIGAVYPEYAEKFTYDKAGNRISHQINIPLGTGTPEMHKKYGAGDEKGIRNKNIQYTYDNCNRYFPKQKYWIKFRNFLQQNKYLYYLKLNCLFSKRRERNGI